MTPRDPVLSDEELAGQLAGLPDWQFVDGRLHRDLVFTDFAAAFAFMGRVAEIAERLDHHPDWSNSWNRVVIDITSHDSGGPTQRCIDLARGIDAVV